MATCSTYIINSVIQLNSNMGQRAMNAMKVTLKTLQNTGWNSSAKSFKNLLLFALYVFIQR